MRTFEVNLDRWDTAAAGSARASSSEEDEASCHGRPDKRVQQGHVVLLHSLWYALRLRALGKASLLGVYAQDRGFQDTRFTIGTE